MKTIQTTWENLPQTFQDNTIYFVNDRDFYIVKKPNCAPCYVQKQYTVVKNNYVTPGSVADTVRTIGLYILHSTDATENDVMLYYYDGEEWHDITTSGGATNYEDIKARLLADGFVQKPLNIIGRVDNNKRIYLSIE